MSILEIAWQPILLSSERRDCFVVNETSLLLKDLFLLRNPKYRFDKNYAQELQAFTNGYEGRIQWFYYPWLNTAVAFLPEVEHQELRTGRNRLLITEEEQKIFYNSTIAVLGMSVGSHAAIVIAMTGGARNIKLADPDTLSGDNLNRIRAGFHNVGTNKAVVTARAIYEINPYANIELFPEGVTEKNCEAILSGADLVIEEMDNPFWKFKVREAAREKGIPVVMGTDNADGNIVDIERYDLDQNYPSFHGLAGDLSAEKLKTMKPEELPAVAAKIAGANLAPKRMLDSVAEVGKTLYSWPQLGTAANLCGSTVAYLARQIILKNPHIKSGRFDVNLNSIFESK